MSLLDNEIQDVEEPQQRADECRKRLKEDGVVCEACHKHTHTWQDCPEVAESYEGMECEAAQKHSCKRCIIKAEESNKEIE